MFHTSVCEFCRSVGLCDSYKLSYVGILLEVCDESKNRSAYTWKAGVTGAERRLKIAKILSQQRSLFSHHDN